VGEVAIDQELLLDSLNDGCAPGFEFLIVAGNHSTIANVLH
jgi:hypothetical protein